MRYNYTYTKEKWGRTEHEPKKQDRQCTVLYCTYRVTLNGLRATIVSLGKQ